MNVQICQRLGGLHRRPGAHRHHHGPVQSRAACASLSCSRQYRMQVWRMGGSWRCVPCLFWFILFELCYWTVPFSGSTAGCFSFFFSTITPFAVSCIRCAWASSTRFGAMPMSLQRIKRSQRMLKKRREKRRRKAIRNEVNGASKEGKSENHRPGSEAWVENAGQ